MRCVRRRRRRHTHPVDILRRARGDTQRQGELERVSREHTVHQGRAPSIGGRARQRSVRLRLFREGKGLDPRRGRFDDRDDVRDARVRRGSSGSAPRVRIRGGYRDGGMVGARGVSMLVLRTLSRNCEPLHDDVVGPEKRRCEERLLGR